MRVLFVPFGSEGDLNPLIWLAEGLAERGHTPVFLVTPHYSRLIERLGFQWFPMGTEEDFVTWARNPLVWDRLQGPHFVVKGMVATLEEYRAGFAAAGTDYDLVVTSSFALAAAALAEKAGLPRLALHMQPVCIRSEYDCPLFMDELGWICRSPRWVKRLFFKLVDLGFWGAAQRPLNKFRREIGVPPIRHFMDDAVNGAKGVAGLFPEWFAEPQPDWPAHLRLFGFPVSRRKAALPPELETFLAEGDPPLVWTHGSANFDIEHFQKRALAASQELGMRCLLVSLDPPKGPLPTGAFHATHARFEDLFPRARIVIHHGGIGTTAKCIMSGVPQLIIPRSHDQPDNAQRIVRLGLGETLRYKNIDTPALAEVLHKLLNSPSVAENCRRYREKMQAEDRLPALCDWAEALAKPSATRGN